MFAPHRTPTLPPAGGSPPDVRLPPVRLTAPQKLRDATRGLIKLGDSWLRAFRFETRRCGEALTCPPRTVGHTCLVLESPSRGGLPVGEREAVALTLRAGNEAASPESAKEKVVFSNGQGETSVYQADRETRAAALCACGNATGASAALLARFRKTT